MRHVIAIMMLRPAPTWLAADPPAAARTRQQRTGSVPYGPGLEAVMQGLVVALVGSSSVERDATKDSWEAGLKKEHVRIKFAKPHQLTAGGDGKSFAATEILLVTVGEHDPDRLLV